MSFMENTFNIEYDGVRYAVDRDVYYYIQVQANRLGLYCCYEEFDGLWSYTFVIKELNEHIKSELFRLKKEENEKLQQPTADTVNHPTHYNSHPSGIECIDVVRYHNFPIGNVIKYCWRAGLKKETDTTEAEMELKDLKKARWYLDDYIKHLEKGIKK